MKPLVTVTKRASSGNVCDVHFFAPSGNTVPTQVQWEHYPPSAEDVRESEQFVCGFLNAAGMSVDSARTKSIVNKQIPIEEIVRRFNSSEVN